jgi:hypothetical protein
MSTTDRAYTIYNSPGNVAAASINFPKNTSQFPRRFYKAEPLNPSKTQPQRYPEAGAIPYPRDPEVDYILFADRDTHPAHFSRFSYPWFLNGYGVGNFPGKYNTPEAMRWQTSALPEDMAPERFYTGDQIDPNYCDSEAYIMSRRARQARANQ